MQAPAVGAENEVEIAVGNVVEWYRGKGFDE